jgi:hypothetical protein
MPSNSGPVSVLTNRNNNARTGAYLNETILKPENVNVTTFGKLFSRTVDGDLYAQPLIVSGLKLGQGPAVNVVFLCTSRNWVYAYDADTPTHSLPFWQVNLGTPVPRNDVFHGYTNFAGEIGITSTPVIDLQKGGKGILYVVSKTRVDGVGAENTEGFEYKIHALDIRNGKPFKFSRKAESPVGANSKKITAIAKDPASGQTVQFDAKWHLNRPGLLLLNGVLYLAFGSQGDAGEFWGWIMAYDARTLEQLAVHCTALTWGEGGIWQSGCGLAGESVIAEDGTSTHYVYAVIGNGQKPIPKIDNGNGNFPRLHTIPAQIENPFYGNCMVKLTLVASSSPLHPDRPPPQGDPKTRFRFDIVDWFTASDCLDLNQADTDFIGGPVLFSAAGKNGQPTDLVLGGGKDGKFYLCDRLNFGKWHPMTGRDPFGLWDSHFQVQTPITLPYQVSAADLQANKSWATTKKGQTQNQIIQDDKLCNFHIHGAPVLWQKSQNEMTAYVWSEKDHCLAYRFDAGKFDTSADSKSQYGFPSRENRMPGGMLALSADGSKSDSGIVWASHPTDDDGMNKTVKGTLRAFDARDLNVELWTSDKNPDGDDRVGNFAKFCPPVVANGKVYVATFSRELVVYGLLEKNLADAKCDIWDLKAVGGGVNGSCKSACGRYNISATSAGLGIPVASREIGGPPGSRDSFYFAYVVIDTEEQPQISITARVLGIQASGSDPKTPEGRAGVMIRAFDENGTLPIVPFASMLFSSLSGALFLRRLVDNTAPTQDASSHTFYPNWLRLSCEARQGADFLRFTGAFSTNGVDWQQLGSPTEIKISGRVLVGLVAMVQNEEATSVSADNVLASFSDVVVAPQIS